MEEKVDTQSESEVVTMRQLLESGVHFGHQTKRWNPKMARYIFTARNGIHVIDLQQTLQLVKEAYSFIESVVTKGQTVLFVGTKKQAQEVVQAEAVRCKQPFINNRWLGGTLTNFSTILKSIKKLNDSTQEEADGVFNVLSKKEASKRRKKLARMELSFGGIKELKNRPGAVFIVDTKKEVLAVNEALKLNIPIVGIVDTNADPTVVKYPIPANDDAIRAIKLICSVMANAVESGNEKHIAWKQEQDAIREKEEAEAKLLAEKEATTQASLESKKDKDKDKDKKEKTSTVVSKKPEKKSTNSKKNIKTKNEPNKEKNTKAPKKPLDSKEITNNEKKTSTKKATTDKIKTSDSKEEK